MLLNYQHRLNNVQVCRKRKSPKNSYISFLFFFPLIASSVGEILKASVNAPCTKEYCTFYKGTDARLEFTFNLSKIMKTFN
jgi:hypothetical protein